MGLSAEVKKMGGEQKRFCAAISARPALIAVAINRL
jgi:hypothetical protein